MSNYDEFFRVLYRDSFTEKPKHKKEIILDTTTEDRNTLGYSHFALVDVIQNEDGTRQKIPFKFMTARTFQTFFGHISNDKALWYTPNTLSTSKALKETRLVQIINGKPVDLLKSSYENKNLDDFEWFNKSSFKEGQSYKISKGGRSEKYVRWINTLFIDIDKKSQSLEEILTCVSSAKLPKPTVVNETTGGYHLYWFLKDRVPATPNATKLYKHITRSIMESLSAIEGIDNKLVDTCRYMQIPRNIIYSDYSLLHDFSTFRDWMNENKILYYRLVNNRDKASKGSNKSSKLYLASPKTKLDRAINVLLRGVPRSKRNDTCFALTCYYKNSGYSKQDTLNILLEWNKKNEDYHIDHTDIAVIKTVTSCFNSEKKGLPYNLISNLSGVSLAGWYKFKKERKDRVRSHIKEWARDILVKLIKIKSKFVTGSQKSLAEFFGMPLSTFKLILKEMKQGKYSALLLNVSGRGKDSCSTIALNQILYKSNPMRFFVELSDDEVLLNETEKLIKLENAAGYEILTRRGSPFYQKVYSAYP